MTQEEEQEQEDDTTPYWLRINQYIAGVRKEKVEDKEEENVSS